MGWSQFQLNNIIDELNEDEVEMHHTITTLVATMGTGQQHLLAETSKSVTSVLTRLRTNNNTRNVWATRIPTSRKTIRNIYCEGKYFLLPHLPRSQIKLLHDHAYVSLKDCIANLLAHGFEVDTISKVGEGEAVTKLSQS